MGVPFTFLLGLLALFVHEHVVEVLPGAEQPWWLCLLLPALPLPALLLRRAVRAARALAQRGKERMARALLALAPLSVPMVFAAAVFASDLPAVAGYWAAGSDTLFLALGLTPLLLIEALYRGEQVRLARGSGRDVLSPPLPMHFGLIGIIVVPLLLAAAALDFVSSDRELRVFCTATSLGQLGSLLLGLGSFLLVLPWLFRWLLPLSSELPPKLAQPLRDTAVALGFPPRAVLAMHTGMRLPNAAMVGFLRWPRFLVLTDALMSLLDVFALRGVLAHEIGHARAGHPPLLLLLVAIIPVLLAYPAQLAALELDPWAAAALASFGLVGLIALVRRVAHRFEHEADVQSAIALGGATPCIDALQRVVRALERTPNRASMLHPGDGDRIDTLMRWELDPAMREAFVRRGVQLRLALRAGGCLALLLAGLALWRLWPLDAAVMAYARGDFRGAQARLDGGVGEGAQMIAALRAELAPRVQAALQLAPDARSWDQAVDRLAEGGLERGVKLLERGLPAQAEPWLALGLSRDDAEPWRVCCYRLAQAAAAGDQARVDRILAHMRAIDAPAEVLRAVGDVRAVPPRQ